ncbi:MAG: GNAT family N-acetyltransferase [Flavobacteriaceae bacterium]|jgi:ElaA protein
MQWQLLSFDELNTLDLYGLLRLRSSVFVVEQNCVYQDLDNKDQKAFHLFGKNEEKIVAYARILAPKSKTSPFSSIGRVVVDAQHRHNKVGGLLMQKAIAFCDTQFQKAPIKISAQKHLQKFYESLGFLYKGEDYLEDNIPHCAMYYSFASKRESNN